MTESLRRAVAAVEQLPDDVQDAIAARLLSEVLDEQAWASQFDSTTDAHWDSIVAAARENIVRVGTIRLEDLLSPSTSE